MNNEYLTRKEKNSMIDLIQKTRRDDENQVFGLALELERWSHSLMADIIKTTGDEDKWIKKIST